VRPDEGSPGDYAENLAYMEKQQKKPKVLFIGPYPPPYSGPELGMKLFLESRLKEVFDIKFLKTNFRKTNVNKGRIDHKSILAFFKFIGKLIFMLIKHKPKLAYYPITATQTGWLGRDIWCLSICRLFGVKTVIHLRGGHLKLNFRTFHPLVQYLVRRACRSVSLAIVQAECLRDQFRSLVPNDRVAVLYQAIEADEYDVNDIDNYDPNQILFLGHLSQAKGYCDLVRAIPLVAKEFHKVQFCFAGPIMNSERNVFFDQNSGALLKYEDPFVVHSNISDGPFKKNYSFLGIVSGQGKMELLRKTNIFVLPSYSEGFSRALLEAMSMGKPVVCTLVGAHKEIIKNGINGFLTEPGNIEQLAGSIISLLNDNDLRNKIGRFNYQYTRENFDIRIIAQRLELCFNEVITEHRF